MIGTKYTTGLMMRQISLVLGDIRISPQRADDCSRVAHKAIFKAQRQLLNQRKAPDLGNGCYK